MAAPMMTIGGLPAAWRRALHRADGGVPAERRHGRHVERFPHTAGADLRQAAAPSPGAGFDEAWDQAGKGRGLSRAGVAFVKELRNQDGRRRRADAGNGGEQLALGAEARVPIEMVPNQVLDVGHLRVQRWRSPSRSRRGPRRRSRPPPAGSVSCVRIPCSASSRRTSAWSCRISRASGAHGAGWCDRRVARDQFRVDPIGLAARELRARRTHG